MLTGLSEIQASIAYDGLVAAATLGIASGVKIGLKPTLTGWNPFPPVNRKIEITELFQKSDPGSGIQIGNRTVLVDPYNRGDAKIFDGVSDIEVKSYFVELTGKPFPATPTTVIPNKGSVYTVSVDGKNYNIRDFSSSGVGRWTIDIHSAMIGRTDNTYVELKFR